MAQLHLNGTGDFADQCSDALLKAKKAAPCGLLRADIAQVLRPLIEEHDAALLAANGHKGKRVAAKLRSTIPPEPEWVSEYSAEVGYPLDGKKWCDVYAAKGWIVSGRARMKDWQAAVRNWAANNWGADTHIYLGPPKPKPTDYRYAPEPNADWRNTALHVLKIEKIPDHWTTWSEVPAEYRAKIAKVHA